MNGVDPMPHGEASELLPWLANGTLESPERERVDAHARTCVICRREFEELVGLAVAIRSSAAAMPAPAPDMRRINARIDAALEKERRGSRLLVLARGFARDPWRLAFAAQSAAIAVLVTVLAWPEPEPAGFTTLTTPESLPAGHHVRVVFDPAMGEPEIAALVESLGLTLVAGPSDRGVATLGTDAPAGNELLSRLLARPGVLFAQPVAEDAP